MIRKMGFLSVAKGFTLVEMLVVLTLTSLIMVGMMGILRGMGQTESRVDARLARMDDFRVSVGFIQSILGNVSARKADVLPASGKPSVMFAGAPQSVAWVGVMPARDGAGGRYFFRLSIEGISNGALAGGVAGADSGLVMRFMPFEVGVNAPEWGAAESRVLVNRVQGVSFEYEDRRENPPTWVSAWEVEDRLPDAVRLNVATATGNWPTLFVPLRALPLGANDGSGVATFGGSTR
jgi:general secretion pathway protein J